MDTMGLGRSEVGAVDRWPKKRSGVWWFFKGTHVTPDWRISGYVYCHSGGYFKVQLLLASICKEIQELYVIQYTPL